MSQDFAQQVCARIVQVRVEQAGPRGKSNFAKKLGLSPSTYDYYESGRLPPADVLLKIADVAGVDLRWLLTGQAQAGGAIGPDHPVVQRVAAMVAKHPQSAQPLAAFVELLAEAMEKFPAKGQLPPAGGAQGASGQGAAWIPILGRTAAGVPQFWASEDEASGLLALGDLIARHAEQSAEATASAQAWADDQDQGDSVQIVTLSGPQDDQPAEFIAAPSLKCRYADAFALRIDGESMAPDIRHGELVVLSPTHEAQDGKPAVVQLARQIGVTCKVFRRQGDQVHLIPLNATFAPQTFPASQVVWALRVLARVRA